MVPDLKKWWVNNGIEYIGSKIVEKHNSGFKKEPKYSKHHVMLSGTKIEQQVTKPK